MKKSPLASINELHAAESVLSLLGRLNAAQLPWEERIGLAAAQASAADDWLACSLPSLRAGLLRQAIRAGVAQARALARE